MTELKRKQFSSEIPEELRLMLITQEPDFLVVLQKLDAFTEIRLTVTTFNGTKWFSIREWYFDGILEEWNPTGNGFTVLYDADIFLRTMAGLEEACKYAKPD